MNDCIHKYIEAYRNRLFIFWQCETCGQWMKQPREQEKGGEG